MGREEEGKDDEDHCDGAGAKPEKCGGHGYGEGPVPLTGHKMLPVLEGAGVPCAPGAFAPPFRRTRPAHPRPAGRKRQSE